MNKQKNNQKLLDKLNAQFAEELGFDVMLRDMTDYLMDKIGMTGQCAVGEDELPGVYEMIADDCPRVKRKRKGIWASIIKRD